MSRPLAACCWTEEMTEHTPALHQSIVTVTGILTSTSIHEPEKGEVLWPVNVSFGIKQK